MDDRKLSQREAGEEEKTVEKPKEEAGGFQTPGQQLRVLNEAIYSIMVGGQSYRIGTRSLTRADLATLISERNRLEAQAAQTNGLIYGAYAADFGYDNRR